MRIWIFALLAWKGFCLAPVAAGDLSASPKLFPDSQMIIRERFSVEVAGHGPDILLIPGLAASRESWAGIAARLKDHFTLHLIQIAGFAGQPAWANAQGPVLEPVAEAIDGYGAELCRGPVVLIGHSLGGTIGLLLAQRHTGHVQKLLVVDSLPFLGAAFGGPAATAESVRPLVATMNARPLPADAADYRQQNRPMISGMVTAQADVERVLAWGAASDPAVVRQVFGEDVLLDLRTGLAGMTTHAAKYVEA